MKNLKQMIEDFQSEAKSRIAKGEFETVEASVSMVSGYFAQIEILIDDVSFRFELSDNGGFICDHSVVKIYPFAIDQSEFSMLEKAFKDFTKANRDNEIAMLQNKILELQK